MEWITEPEQPGQGKGRDAGYTVTAQATPGPADEAIGAAVTADQYG